MVTSSKIDKKGNNFSIFGSKKKSKKELEKEEKTLEKSLKKEKKEKIEKPLLDAAIIKKEPK